MYKNILDSQINFTKQMMSGYGNMTGVEKKLNKADLLAWKHYDNNQYALIPGIQHKLLENKYKRNANGDLNMSVDNTPFKRSRANLNQSVDLSSSKGKFGTLGGEVENAANAAYVNPLDNNQTRSFSHSRNRS